MFPLPELCIAPARIGHEVTFRSLSPHSGARSLAPAWPRQSSPVHTTLVSTLLKHLSLDRLRIEIPSAYRTISAAETTRAPSRQGRVWRQGSLDRNLVRLFTRSAVEHSLSLHHPGNGRLMMLHGDWRARFSYGPNSAIIYLRCRTVRSTPPGSHAMASALSSQDHDQSSSDTEQTDISARQKTP